MKFGCFIESDPQLIDLGVLAEKSGFDSVWLSDHFNSWNIDKQRSETWMTLTAIGLKTERITLGSGVTDPFKRQPALLAQAVATLDSFTKGRAALGIGGGELTEMAPYGVEHKRPAARLAETVRLVKKLWEATPYEPVNYAGEFYRFKDAFIQMKPFRRPHPPVYISAASPATRRVAGEVGDGWLSWVNTPEGFHADLKEVKMAAENAGRSIEDMDTVAWMQTAVAKEHEAARRAIAKRGKAILVLAQDKLRRMGIDIRAPRELSLTRVIASPESVKALDEASRLLPDDLVEKTCVFGTPDDCIAGFERYIKAGAKHIMIRDRWEQPEEVFNLYKSKIIPYFKQSIDS